MNCLVCSFGGVTSAELRTPGGMRWRRAYPGRRDQARSARRFVGFLLDGFPRVDEAVFATAELAANAVRHTRSGLPGGWFEVEVRRWPESAAVAVIDQGSAGAPRLREVGELAECGRGLRAVRTVADCLAWSGGQGGRTVFAIFGVRAEAAGATGGR